MKKPELEKFKDNLIKLREEIAGEISNISADALKKSQRDASGDLSGYTLHLADMATDHYDREFSLGLASNGREALLLIDEALKRVEDKSFGKCLSCDKPIKKKRLKALPYAQYCIACQSKEEHHKKNVPEA